MGGKETILFWEAEPIVKSIHWYMDFHSVVTPKYLPNGELYLPFRYLGLHIDCINALIEDQDSFILEPRMTKVHELSREWVETKVEALLVYEHRFLLKDGPDRSTERSHERVPLRDIIEVGQEVID